MEHERDQSPQPALQLEKKTLRTLLDDELDHVAGGYGFGSRDTGTEYGPVCWWNAGGHSHNY
jgi:hypothetical protein